jgi:hypothetical protein
MQAPVHTRVTEYRGSRWKAALGLALCAGFVLLGRWLSLDTSSFRSMFAGWLSIVVFGPMLALWLGAVITPMRLTVSADGFTFKQPFLPTKHYQWDRIDNLWAEQLRLSSIVVWTYKVRPKGLARVKSLIGQPNHYDAYLPFGWTVSAEDIARDLSDARSEATCIRNVR